MTGPDPSLADRAVAGIAARLSFLADRPGLLLAVCFALNAAFLPYAGLFQDAALYAGQVEQAATGRLADDLFFRYGSQSRFTLFPELLAIPARVFGVAPVFAVGYLGCTLLRLWAVQRLTFRVFGRTPAAVAALLATAVTPGWWEASCALGLGENFFTARLPGTALAILGLERAVAGRWWAAGGLFAAALLVHPLMAAPAVGVAVGYAMFGWATTPARRWALAGLAAAVVAAWWGAALTADTLDPEWKRLCLVAQSHIDPRAWRPADQFRVAFGAVCVGWAAALLHGSRGRAGWAALAVAGGGLACHFAVVHGSWAAGYQMQPFRGLWPLELLRVPAGLTVAARLWAGDPVRKAAGAAVAVALFACPGWEQAACWAFLAAAVGLAVMGCRMATPGDPGRWVRGAVVGGVGWVVGWQAATTVRLAWPPADGEADAVLPAAVLGGLLLTGVVSVLAAVGREVWAGRCRAGVVAAAGLAAFAAWAVVPKAGPVEHLFDARAPDRQFVRAVLDANDRSGRTATVYWPGPPPDQMWLGLGANSYYNPAQMSGNLFHRATAVEGDRRLRLVVPFEVERLRRELGLPADPGATAGSSPINRPPPTADELRTLMSQPGLDFVVLTADYGGAIATNGSVWVYDCRRDRSVAQRGATEK